MGGMGRILPTGLRMPFTKIFHRFFPAKDKTRIFTFLSGNRNKPAS